MNLLATTFDRFIAPKPRRKYKKRIKTRSRSGTWAMMPFDDHRNLFPGLVPPHDPADDTSPWMDGRLTNIQAWVRSCLTYYMAYREVPTPLLNEAGEVVLDNFGRPKLSPENIHDGGIEDLHHIAKGAVWMTKETLRRGWATAFNNEGRYADDFPDQYVIPDYEMACTPEAGGEFSDKNKRDRPKMRSMSNAHPMDKFFLRMVEDSRIIRCPHKQGRYMFSQQMCYEACLPEAWDVHRDRGTRWEGLEYTYDKRPADQVYSKRKGNSLYSHIDIYIPNTTILSMRHPRQVVWNDVLSDLAPFMLFDWEIVAAAAVQRGLMKTLKRSGAVTDHIDQWIKNGKIKRIFPGVFRSEEFWEWNSKRHFGARPNCMIHKDWFIAFAEDFARMQYRTPTMSFTVGSVFDWIMSNSDADLDRWFGSREPTKGMVSTRLNDLISKSGRVVPLSGRKRQLSPEMIDIFKAAWTKPGVATPEDTRDLDTARRFMMLEGMVLDDAIRCVTMMEDAFVVKMLMQRIDKDSKTEIEKLDRVRILGRKVNRTTTAMIKAYKNGDFDPPERWES